MKLIKKQLAICILIIILILNFPINIKAEFVLDDEKIIISASKIIYEIEGNYGSINPNDRGALSIGKIQWHATRALELLKIIIKMNDEQAKVILEENLYNEILQSTNWNSRVLNREESDKISMLLITDEGKAAQDKLSDDDIMSYISHGRKLDFTDPKVLIFFADVENQCGYSGAESVFKYLLKIVNSYEKASLENAYQASIDYANAVITNETNLTLFKNRRLKVYNYANLLPFYEDDLFAPIIKNVEISDISDTGYTITCEATDEGYGIDRVMFSTWFTNGEYTSEIHASKGVLVDKNKFSCRVNFNEYGCVSGHYVTRIYAYDKNNNYAFDMGITHMYTSSSLIGDVNLDGFINNTDLIYICQSLIEERALSSQEYQNADVVKDGVVDIADVATMKQYLLGDNVILGQY